MVGRLVTRAPGLAAIVFMMLFFSTFSTLTEAGAIGLGWNASSGATGYRVHYGRSPALTEGTVDVRGARSATIEGLADCTTWYFGVSAYNAAGESAPSTPVASWPRPHVGTLTPENGPAVPLRQGSELRLVLQGANLPDGVAVELEPEAGWDCPADPEQAPGCLAALRETVRLTATQRRDCNRVDFDLAVEPTGAGRRAALAGEWTLKVSNPNGLEGTYPVTLQVDESRLDINRQDNSTDGRIDGKDIVWLARLFGACDEIQHGTGRCAPSRFDPDYDFDGDGFIDGVDLQFLAARNLGRIWNGNQWVCPLGAGTCSN